MGLPLVRPLGRGLWEAEQHYGWKNRPGDLLRDEGEMFLLHAFIKKNAEDPAAGYGSGIETNERIRKMRRENKGSSFDDWLREEGIYEEVSAAAIKRVLARQIEQAMKEKQLSKAEVARRMRTSRAALDRLLDPQNGSATLNTLYKAAAAVGRQVRLELV